MPDNQLPDFTSTYTLLGTGGSSTEDVEFSNRADTIAVLDALELHQAALAAQDGEAELAIDAEAPLAASLAPRGAMQQAGTQTVRTLSLVPFLDQSVGLLKMDIEGAEGDVLEACLRGHRGTRTHRSCPRAYRGCPRAY